jgi:hypothetical protein
MLDAKHRTDDDTLVSVQTQELVVPSDEVATNVAQPQYTTLASSICSYLRSAAGERSYHDPARRRSYQTGEYLHVVEMSEKIQNQIVVAMRSR